MLRHTTTFLLHIINGRIREYARKRVSLLSHTKSNVKIRRIEVTVKNKKLNYYGNLKPDVERK